MPKIFGMFVAVMRNVMDKPTEDKRFFGRRKGKPIKGSRQRLIDELLPRVVLHDADSITPNLLFGIKPREV